MPQAQQGNNIFDSAQINPGVIQTTDIADEAITNAKIKSDAAIAQSKLTLSITNTEVNASAAIADSKLATISTAGKVDGAALTGFANIPAGAGNIPAANLGNAPAGKTVFVPANAGYGGAGIVPGAGTVFACPYVSYPDGVSSGWGMFVQAPAGATGITSVKLFISTPASGGNIMQGQQMVKFDNDSIAAGVSDSSGAQTTFAMPATANQITQITVPSSAWDGLGTIDGGDLICIWFDRDATSGSDTVANAVHYYGAEIVFT